MGRPGSNLRSARGGDGGTDRRVLVLAVCPYLVCSGAERQLMLLCRHIDRERFVLKVAHYEGGYDPGFVRDLQDTGTPLVYLDRPANGTLGVVRGLRRLIRREKPDVLQCWLPSAYRLGRLAALGLSVPVVLAMERNVDYARPFRRRLDRLLNPWTTCWVGNSIPVADFVRTELGVPADRVHVVRNAVDPAPFQDADVHPAVRDLRDSGRRVVVNVGRLAAQKNQMLFLRVAEALLESFDDLAFVLCGDGPMADELRAEAARRGLSERTTFLGREPNVPSVLAGAEMLVQTSDFEGMPNVVMEGCCAGLAVVATDAGGTRELIDDGVHGFVVPVGEQAALVDRCRRVLGDADLARSLGEAARSRMLREFSPRTMARTYERLFLDMLGRRAGGTRPPLRARSLPKPVRAAVLAAYYGLASRLPRSNAPYAFGAGALRRWLCRRLFRHVGVGANIERGAYFGSGAELSLGDHSGLGIRYQGVGPITIGNDVMMGPDVTILTGSHETSDTTRPMRLQGGSIRPVVIEDDVWIGMRAIILPGVRIGTGAIIGAAAVVTRDVPPFAVVAGVPARVLRYRTAERRRENPAPSAAEGDAAFRAALGVREEPCESR